ncbi:MAG: hypothetical protein AVDCRST_MAG91-2869 [uncultured Sphingomonadaceae bacterium]|uniref:Uncharacterized protein n=1 Tax=uncultured Sphingomonadaceae bacterium TaxID=169976 RepID=A0A6J4TR78_9SPHN|nr:MAG: hypothetical protein AVDCRST_MAG91-2869 [uncultured Sphingomonadaceae bacterium]
MALIVSSRLGKPSKKGCVEGLRCLQPSHRLGKSAQFENQIRRTGIVPTCGQPACFPQPSFAPAKESFKERTRGKNQKRNPNEAQAGIISLGGGSTNRSNARLLSARHRGPERVHARSALEACLRYCPEKKQQQAPWAWAGGHSGPQPGRRPRRAPREPEPGRDRPRGPGRPPPGRSRMTCRSSLVACLVHPRLAPPQNRPRRPYRRSSCRTASRLRRQPSAGR